MPLFDFTGNATVTTLDAPISDIDLTLTLTSPSGWPDGSDGDWTMTLDRGKDGLEEKLRCGARVGGDVTILQRGYDDTSPVAHSLPSTAEHTINAVWAKDTSKHIYNTARDDHTQYMKADGVRHDVTARHLFGTSIPTGVPSSVGTALTEGVSTS